MEGWGSYDTSGAVTTGNVGGGGGGSLGSDVNITNSYPSMKDHVRSKAGNNPHYFMTAMIFVLAYGVFTLATGSHMLVLKKHTPSVHEQHIADGLGWTTLLLSFVLICLSAYVIYHIWKRQPVFGITWMDSDVPPSTFT